MGSILDLEFITSRNLNSSSRELVTSVALILRILIWNFGHVNISGLDISFVSVLERVSTHPGEIL